ncbi:MAG: hypothetical protein H8D35_02025 [Nitrosopumilus sp.]|nr:hypothetical protein [Nitrosopumilus sp.]
MVGIDSNNGVFLTKEEWETFIRWGIPVRYNRNKKKSFCQICGKPPSKDNPFDHSHMIGYSVGIVTFGLTPDFLNSDENIVSAHRKLCNSKAEITTQDVCEKLKSLGIDKLPDFLPSEIRDSFLNTTL